jgi:protein associated with RNAse G/E
MAAARDTTGDRHRWRPGDPLVITEVWQGRLWSAIPHTLVSADGTGHVTYLAPDAVGAYATSRGVPGREHLSRGERKLAALQTLVYQVVEVPHHFTPLASLHFFRPGSWARVNLGWSADLSQFLGWYVNFEVPYQVVDHGLQTMDLVLDMLVTPDRTWRWKDRDEFDDALARGLLSADIAAALEAEAKQVTDQIARGHGPFADGWPAWRPDPRWSTPALPPHLRARSAAWERAVR